jgi:hypothetical protein
VIEQRAGADNHEPLAGSESQLGKLRDGFTAGRLHNEVCAIDQLIERQVGGWVWDACKKRLSGSLSSACDTGYRCGEPAICAGENECTANRATTNDAD